MIEYEDSQFEDALSGFLSQFQNKDRINALIDAMFGDTGVQELEDDFRDLRQYHILSNAVGDQLDQWGTLVGEEREGLSDDDYRDFIRARAAVNYLDVSRANMVTVAARLPGVPVRSRIKTELTGVGGTTIPEDSKVEDAEGNIWRTQTQHTLDATAFLESERTVFEEGGYPQIDASQLDTSLGSNFIISDINDWNEAEALEDSVSGVRYRNKFPAGYLLTVTVDGSPSSSLLDKMRALLEDAKPAGVQIDAVKRGGDEDDYFQLDTGNGHQLDAGKLGSAV